MRAVDIFAGAGGFSLGLMRAGFDVVLANELSSEPEWTFRANLLAGEEARFPRRPDEAGSRERASYRATVREQIFRERTELLDDLDRRMRGGDIRQVMPNQWLRRWLKHHEEVDVLVAGPPCQGFSSAGARDPEDERNGLAGEAIRVIRQLQPKVAIIENVPGMLARHPNKVQQLGLELSRRRRGSGPAYKVVAQLLSGAQLGVPQTRQRLLIVGVREDLLNAGVWEKLAPSLFPTACPAARFDVGQDVRFVSGGQCLTSHEVAGDLRHLPPPHGGKDSSWFCEYAEPAGRSTFRNEVRASRASYLAGECTAGRRNSSYANHDASVHKEHVARRMRLLREAAEGSPDGRANRCSSGWLKEQFMDGHPELETCKASQRVLLADEWPALTVTSLPDDIVHFSEDRIPTVREMARLQTFPDWFEFMGVRTTGADRRKAGILVPQYTQVANAVPPRLAYAVAARVRWFLQRVDEQGDRDCDFELPGGRYRARDLDSEFYKTLRNLNHCFAEATARRERLVRRAQPDQGATLADRVPRTTGCGAEVNDRPVECLGTSGMLDETSGDSVNVRVAT